jgi:hypothetical protein
MVRADLLTADTTLGCAGRSMLKRDSVNLNEKFISPRSSDQATWNGRLKRPRVRLPSLPRHSLMGRYRVAAGALLPLIGLRRGAAVAAGDDGGAGQQRR